MQVIPARQSDYRNEFAQFVAQKSGSSDPAGVSGDIVELKSLRTDFGDDSIIRIMNGQHRIPKATRELDEVLREIEDRARSKCGTAQGPRSPERFNVACLPGSSNEIAKVCCLGTDLDSPSYVGYVHGTPHQPGGLLYLQQVDRQQLQREMRETLA